MFNFRRQALKRKILNDPFYRFQSLEEVAIAVESGIFIDVNQATVDDWLRLPGLSIHQARNLVSLTGSGLQFLCLADLAAALGVPSQRLKPVEPILAFIYYEKDSLVSPSSVNVNNATLGELLEIPGLSKMMAELTLEKRQMGGKFLHLADFQQRLGLTGDVVADLMHYLRF